MCTLSEAELAERERWLVTFASGVEATSALPDGCEARFPASWGARLFELIEKERACCSSLAFELRFEPEGGPILLRVRGDELATAFMKSRHVPGR